MASDLQLQQFAQQLREPLKTYFAHLDTFYAEGTWTPTYAGGTTAGTTTYTTQVGFYTRLGRVVFFTAYVVWTGATGTGRVLVSLPLTPSATTDMRYAVALKSTNVTFANGSIQGRIPPGDNHIYLDSPATNAASTDVAVEAAGDLILSGFFFM